MDKEKFGKLLRGIREDRGLTREQLANGLCSSTYIYNIERGQYAPSPFIIRGLTRKLSYDFYEGIESSIYENPRKVKEIKEELFHSFASSNLKRLNEIITNESVRQLMVCDDDKQLFLWYEGVIECKLNHKYDKAREKLITALGLSNDKFSPEAIKGTFFTRRELRIVLSFAVTYYFQGEFYKAIQLYRSLIPTYQRFYPDSSEIVEFYYNFAFALFSIKEYKKSLNMIIHIETRLAGVTDLHLIADIFHLKGRNQFILDLKQDSSKSFNSFIAFKSIVEHDKKKLEMYKTTIHAKYGFDL